MFVKDRAEKQNLSPGPGDYEAANVGGTFESQYSKSGVISTQVLRTI